MIVPFRALLLIPICLLLPWPAQSADPSLREQALASLKKAVTFFQSRVAVRGTYLWEYSLDLTQREGEGVADPDQGWIQPPGTPAVGLALLDAFQATGDAFYLQAAQQTAHGLIQGQLLSGGWYYHVHFNKPGRRKLAYRKNGNPRARNVTTLDDDVTQAALRFLMKTDRALHFLDPAIQDSIRYALDHLLAAQYPNGAWPQGFDAPPDPEQYPVKPASYPDTWPRTWPGSRQYWLRYTFNDNVQANMIETLFLADTIYGAPANDSPLRAYAARCRQSAVMTGDFILLAQMPEPQPAWAQQYDFDMHPSWARKFEPPAVTGGESQNLLRTLLALYETTGQDRYLDPIPPALAYLKRSRLPDGRLARFYELRSNRPLYFDRDYQLTYADDNLPTHYAFKVSDQTAAIEREYRRIRQSPPQTSSKDNGPVLSSPPPVSSRQVLQILENQDDQGRWVEQGPLRFHRPKDPSVRILRASTFIRNVRALARYLKSTPPGD